MANERNRAANLDPPQIPPYGTGTIAEILPSIVALLSGNDPAANTLDLPESLTPAGQVCVLLVDGLGQQIILNHPDEAPTLNALATNGVSRSISTCFPSTTATSLASFGTGLPAGQHGLVGYTIYPPKLKKVVNLLKFAVYGKSAGGSIVRQFNPYELQPHNTAFELALAKGIDTVTIAEPDFATSGLTQAVLRGPRFVGAPKPADVVARVEEEFRPQGRRLVYTYYSTLDRIGHVHGITSPKFETEVGNVDRFVSSLIEALPPGTQLLITGDHGMINILDRDKIDFDHEPVLQYGVNVLSGEPRMRHVHAKPGAGPEVLARWKDRLRHEAWVVTGEEAIESGWFGPIVEDRVRPFIGDVIAAFHQPTGVFQTSVDQLQARLVGHHGSFTDAETQVPLLIHTT